MAALDLPLDELIKAQKKKAPKPAKKAEAKAKATCVVERIGAIATFFYSAPNRISIPWAL